MSMSFARPYADGRRSKNERNGEQDRSSELRVVEHLLVKIGRIA